MTKVGSTTLKNFHSYILTACEVSVLHSTRPWQTLYKVGGTEGKLRSVPVKNGCKCALFLHVPGQKGDQHRASQIENQTDRDVKVLRTNTLQLLSLISYNCGRLIGVELIMLSYFSTTRKFLVFAVIMHNFYT